MFIGEFLDGPMQDTRYEFIGRAKPYADLYVMPNPSADAADTPWIIVGHTGREPEQPFPGQVQYRLHRIATDKCVRGLYRVLPEGSC